MRFEFEYRGQPVVYRQLESVVAVHLNQSLRAGMTPGRARTQLGLKRARDDSHGPSAALPARNRKIFEKAGWEFVEARPHLVQAALTRVPAKVPVDIHPVLVDASGNVFIGTTCVVVELQPDIGSNAAVAQLLADGLTLVRALRFGNNLFEVRLPPGPPAAELIAALRAKAEYVFVEPTFVEALPGRSDPDFGKQWHHENTGQSNGTPGADIGSRLAWTKSRGTNRRIAIIDNGMQVTHPDLVRQIDSGGYFTPDGTCGAEFHPFKPGEYFRDDTHGTFCMGLAAAEQDNGIHGCGVAPEARLIAIASNLDQLTTQATLARAVAFAADPTLENAGLTSHDGADVLSCSLGPTDGHWQMSAVLDRAISFAARTGRQGLGLPIFWAVANAPVDIVNDNVCSHLDVIAVGQSSSDDYEVGGAYGDKLAFLAPGYLVYSTTSGDGFAVDQGASFACPVAAGVAALVLGRYPKWTRDEVRQRLFDSCEKVGDPPGGYIHGRHRDYGFGRINAVWAVK